MLFEAGKLKQDWSWKAAALDLSIRLNSLLREIMTGKSMSKTNTRRWLICNRQEAIKLNNKQLDRENIGQGTLSYVTIYRAIEESGIATEGFHSIRAAAMDYVRNNWGVYAAEMRRCFNAVGKDIPRDPDGLYQTALDRFNRAIFLDIRDQRTLDVINSLKVLIYEQYISYDEAVNELKLSAATAKRLRPYVEEGKQFVGRKLGNAAVRIYLREFCQTWIDLYYGTDRVLKRQLYLNLNIPVPASSVIAEDRTLFNEVLSQI